VDELAYGVPRRHRHSAANLFAPSRPRCAAGRHLRCPLGRIAALSWAFCPMSSSPARPKSDQSAPKVLSKSAQATVLRFAIFRFLGQPPGSRQPRSAWRTCARFSDRRPVPHPAICRADPGPRKRAAAPLQLYSSIDNKSNRSLGTSARQTVSNSAQTLPRHYANGWAGCWRARSRLRQQYQLAMVA
jgi:hypothetical protein